jgi:hypothetical protein
MTDESQQNRATRQEIDPKAFFSEYAELQTEYSVLKLLLSILAGASITLKSHSGNREVTDAITAARNSVEARMIAIGAWMNAAGKDAAAAIDLIKATPPTEKKQ